jgi:hypothetical protein
MSVAPTTCRWVLAENSELLNSAFMRFKVRLLRLASMPVHGRPLTAGFAVALKEATQPELQRTRPRSW